MFGEAPPRAGLFLAGLDIAWTAWLLARLGVGLALPVVDHASRNATVLESDSWTGPAKLFSEIMGFSLGVGVPLGFLLLLISIASLVHGTARSEPRIFRVLLGGTIALALVLVALCTLGGLVSGD